MLHTKPHSLLLSLEQTVKDKSVTLENHTDVLHMSHTKPHSLLLSLEQTVKDISVTLENHIHVLHFLLFILQQ